jgi:hypothetical protein
MMGRSPIMPANRKLLRNQSFHLLALLLSVSAHMGLAFVVGNGNGKGNAPLPVPPIVAQLYATGSAGEADNPKNSVPMRADSAPDAPQAAYHGEPAPQASDGPARSSPSQTAAHGPSEEPSPLPVLQGTPPYYYLLSELTENPVLVRDIAPYKVEVLPDMSRRPVVVQLLISEKGDVDQVMIEGTSLSEQAKRYIREAFATAKFRAGKIGDLQVKSELSIEVTLEQVLAVPGQGPVLVQ